MASRSRLAGRISDRMSLSGGQRCCDFPAANTSEHVRRIGTTGRRRSGRRVLSPCSLCRGARPGPTGDRAPAGAGRHPLGAGAVAPLSGDRGGAGLAGRADAGDRAAGATGRRDGRQTRISASFGRIASAAGVGRSAAGADAVADARGPRPTVAAGTVAGAGQAVGPAGG